MSNIGLGLIIVGINVFLVGYWFLGRSSGEEQCIPPITTSNKAGGISGIVIGLILMILGIVINLTQPTVQ